MMAINESSRLAPPRPVSARTAQGIRLLTSFFRGRDEHMRKHLFKRKLRPSFLRDCLLRHLVLDLHHERAPTLKELQAAMAFMASNSATALELKQLIAAGLVVRFKVGEGRSAHRYEPAPRTAAYYESAMASLEEELRSMLETLP